MNRFITASATTHSATAAQRKRPHVRALSQPSLPQCLLAPLRYERNYSYPLLVWLHDDGGSERELTRIMLLVSLRNYVSLAVRGTSTSGGRYEWPETADAILAAEARIAEAVEMARQRFNVHANRIFLAGAGA